MNTHCVSLGGSLPKLTPGIARTRDWATISRATL
ncbi:hypothetical protein ABIB94_008420 [Bradyrhizobium sp. JR7.2]